MLWIGCARAGECPDWLVEPYTTLPVNGTPGRPSELLSGYAVLRQPQLSTEPYFLMSTTTQRQTEGHEHPDRGSFSLYHQGTPIVLDPVSRHSYRCHLGCMLLKMPAISSLTGCRLVRLPMV